LDEYFPRNVNNIAVASSSLAVGRPLPFQIVAFVSLSVVSTGPSVATSHTVISLLLLVCDTKSFMNCSALLGSMIIDKTYSIRFANMLW
jgi:hypothetical protein